jgi:hypothetical protein
MIRMMTVISSVFRLSLVYFDLQEFLHLSYYFLNLSYSLSLLAEAILS